MAAFSVSLSFTQSVGLLGRGISPSQGRYLHTEQHEHRINGDRHPCLKWDSNQRSQCLSGRRKRHALDRAATVIGQVAIHLPQLHKQLHEAESFVEATSCSANQKKLLNFYGIRKFVTCSQQPAIGSHLEPD
jgi:hypothetical protein